MCIRTCVSIYPLFSSIGLSILCQYHSLMFYNKSFHQGALSTYFVFMFQNCSDSSKTCKFPYGLNNLYSNFYKKPAENLIGIVWNLQVTLSTIDTLTVSSLPVDLSPFTQVFLSFSQWCVKIQCTDLTYIWLNLYLNISFFILF